MADDVDRVTDQQERILAATIAAARAPSTCGALICEDCDEEIPARRREAMPSARRCARCQQQKEMRR